MLYWSPALKTNQLGKQQLEFYSSDVPGKYIAVVQGITKNGRPGSARFTFQVINRDHINCTGDQGVYRNGIAKAGANAVVRQHAGKKIGLILLAAVLGMFLMDGCLDPYSIPARAVQRPLPGYRRVSRYEWPDGHPAEFNHLIGFG